MLCGHTATHTDPHVAKVLWSVIKRLEFKDMNVDVGSFISMLIFDAWELRLWNKLFQFKSMQEILHCTIDFYDFTWQ